jgi:Mitochondrial K+-H+ exchange-related
MSERAPDGERLTEAVDNAVIYLVPVGSERFELYSEPPADAESEPDAEGSGFWRNLAQRAQARWRDAVRTARHTDADDGLFSRARDAVVRRTADAIAEQRTLWTLRRVATAELVHPSDRTPNEAAAIRDRILNRARTHHLKWLFVDAVVLIASGIFMLVPGPNVIAYYFAFRVAGHYFSWRGARQGLQATRWALRSEPALVELGQLAHLPPDTRAPRLHAIATDLNLPRLAAFFDRTAA